MPTLEEGAEVSSPRNCAEHEEHPTEQYAQTCGKANDRIGARNQHPWRGEAMHGEYRRNADKGQAQKEHLRVTEANRSHCREDAKTKGGQRSRRHNVEMRHRHAQLNIEVCVQSDEKEDQKGQGEQQPPEESKKGNGSSNHQHDLLRVAC